MTTPQNHHPAEEKNKVRKGLEYGSFSARRRMQKHARSEEALKRLTSSSAALAPSPPVGKSSGMPVTRKFDKRRSKLVDIHQSAIQWIAQQINPLTWEFVLVLLIVVTACSSSFPFFKSWELDSLRIISREGDGTFGTSE